MRDIHIGLLWHSLRSRNLGVGALTVGNLAIARGVAAGMGLTPRFTVFQSDDPGQPYFTQPDVTEFPLTARTILNPAGFRAAAARCDVMLDIGGGDSFADIYPAKRFLWMTLTKAATFSARVPLIFSPQTIGPFSKSPYQEIAAWLLRRARAVAVRDDRSAAALKALAPEITPVLGIDVAFAMPFTPRLKATARRRIGVNVSGLLWNGGYSGRGEFNLGYNYRSAIEQLLTRLHADADIDIELISHANASGTDRTDDDGAVADILVKRFPRFTRVPDFASPVDAKGWISGLDLLVAARMHACIAAYSSGVPVVPMSYSRKFEGLFGTLGYPTMVPHTGMGTEDSLALLTAACADPAALRLRMAPGEAVIAARTEAYRALLRTVFAEVTR